MQESWYIHICEFKHQDYDQIITIIYRDTEIHRIHCHYMWCANMNAWHCLTTSCGIPPPVHCSLPPPHPGQDHFPTPWWTSLAHSDCSYKHNKVIIIIIIMYKEWASEASSLLYPCAILHVWLTTFPYIVMRMRREQASTRAHPVQSCDFVNQLAKEFVTCLAASLARGPKRRRLE